MPTEPQPIRLSQIVRRAAEIVDPDDDDAVVGDFERVFEDADEPVTGVLDDIETRVGTALAELDPAVANGSLSMAGALTIYLSFRRDELNADDEELIRLATRAEWEGRPPAAVEDWLATRGISV
ncbi:MAG TPA: hypothetical protein VG371_11720 [Solirubrobacteraceae bacterium]|nr:hypothetical protein [Solirubrobacteraceae bacterium]